MRIVWQIEKASSPAERPEMLADEGDQLLGWTTDRALALRFIERHHANRFAQNRVPVPVRVVDVVIDEPTGLAADNITLRASRDAMDAFKASQAAALA